MSKALTADEILAAKEPGDLFSGNPNTLRSEFRDLVKLWHPDVNTHPRANDMLRIITTLHDKADDMLRDGSWKKKNMIRFVSKDGKVHEINFLVARDFELGKMYISDHVVTYILPESNRNFFENAERVIRGLHYPDANMQKEFARYMPNIITTFQTRENELGMVIAKSPDLLSLRDVAEYFKGTMCERHVAWIESTLLNIICYLDYAKLSHNAIMLDTCFISPGLHSIALLGGWWYAVNRGGNLLGVPSEVYSVMSPIVKHSRIGDICTDMNCARLIGRQLLGDPGGSRLPLMGVAPEPMVQWLRSAPPNMALGDYQIWNSVLKSSFGERKFITMNLDSNMLYKNK